MGCCASTLASTAVASFEHPSTPPAPQTTTTVPVSHQTSLETSPIPSSRTRTRTKSMPESTHHSRSRMSSEGSNPRNTIKSASQLPQSSKSSSSQNNLTRAKSLVEPKRVNRSPISPSRAIQTSIEYVVCPLTLSSFICLDLRNGRRRE